MSAIISAYCICSAAMSQPGAAMFDRAFKLKPQDAQVRFNNVRASVAHGAALWSQRQYGEAIAAFRRALHCDPGNAVALVNLINALGRTGCRAERSDFVADTSAPAGTHVLIACMPKSGSSFLKEALHCLTGWPDAGFSYAYFQNEQKGPCWREQRSEWKRLRTSV